MGFRCLALASLTAAAELTEADVAIVRFHLDDGADEAPQWAPLLQQQRRCNGTVTGGANVGNPAWFPPSPLVR